MGIKSLVVICQVLFSIIKYESFKFLINRGLNMNCSSNNMINLNKKIPEDEQEKYLKLIH